MKLALAYHLCPLNGYNWNLERLAQYVKIFDGPKVVALATLHKVNTEKVVQEIYDYLGKDTIIKRVPNDPINREAVTFHNIFRQLDLKVDRKNSAIWYGHSKSITHTNKKYSEVTKLWAAACYYYTLSEGYRQQNLDFLEKGYAISGPFRRIGLQKNFPPQKYPFHYSGTFFWMNTKEFFASHWKTEIPLHRYAIEALPGTLFPGHKSACVFGDNARDLYKESAWDRLLKPELRKALLK